MHCLACHASLVTDALFCHQCGSSVTSVAEPSPAHPEGLARAVKRLLPTGYLKHVLTGDGKLISDRRVVTTVFIDLVNSTGITERLDPEDVTELLNLAFATMAEPIRRYEGTIARLMGDGMLCLFGAPVAHENDPARACHAALEIIEGFRALAPDACAKYGITSFTVRAGISTGLAVVGEVGTADRAEYTAIGDAVNLAARLQAVTEPGTVLVCSDTWRLVRATMVCRDMGQVSVRGKTQPIPVYRVLPPDSEMELPSSGRQDIPMAGRQEELAACKQAVHDLIENRSGILLIDGAAGLGKSRLVAETRLASPPGVEWSEARSLAHTSAISYETARELLRGLLGVTPWTKGRPLSAHVRKAVSSLFSSPSEGPEESAVARELVISMSAVFGHLLHAPLRQQEKKYLDSLEPGFLHQHIAACVCTYVNLAACRKPVVLVWEDVQWIDVESREVLTALSALSRDLPLLLIVTRRPDPERPCLWLDNLIHCANRPVREIMVEPLGVVDCHKLLQDLLAVPDVPHHIADPLLQVAEGNPHFLQELVHSLLDRGQLTRADADSLRSRPLGSLDIPRSVQAAILSRIDILDGPVKRVIQTASVLGRIIDAEVVRQMLVPEMLPETCEEAFSLLNNRDFIRPETDTEVPETDAPQSPPAHAGTSKHCAACKRYFFTQALTQEVVYNSLLKSQRQPLHRKAGEIIESLHADYLEPVAPLLAYHFELGGDMAKAVRYLCQSAEYSTQVCAVDAAAEAYTRALTLIEHLSNQFDKSLLAALYEGLGDVYYLGSKYADALRQYDQAWAIQTSPQRKSMLSLKRGRLFEKWGRYDAAKEVLESGLDRLTTEFDPQLAAKFYSGLCLVYYHLNELASAGELGRLALEIERSGKDLRGIAQACNNLGVVSMKQKDWAAAEAYFGECQSLWERLGDNYGLATCHNNLGLVAQELGNSKMAIGSFEQSLALFSQLGNKHGMARAYDNLAELMNALGDYQQAEEYLGKAVALLAEIGVDSTGAVAEIWQSGVW